MTNKVHTIPFRVYYEDTDAGGVMYHANHLKFCERGRTEFLRHIGFENTELKETQGIIFVVRHLEAHYFKAARLEDSVEVRTSVRAVKGTSFQLDQSIYRDNELLFEMLVTLVCVHAHNIVAERLPKALTDALKDYMSENEKDI